MIKKWVALGFLLAALLSSAAQAKNDKNNDDKGLKIHANGEGAMVIRCDPGVNPNCRGVQAVVVPVKNPKAQEAIDRGQGKAQFTPPVPAPPPPPPCKTDTRLAAHDITAVADTVATRNGFAVFRSFDRYDDLATSYAIYGMSFMSPSAAFPDIPNCAESNCWWDLGSFYDRSSPLMLVLINAFAGDGGVMNIGAGETLSFTYDEGRIAKIVFPEAMSIVQWDSLTFFVSAPASATGESHLYWDYDLKVPMGTLPADYWPL